MQVNSFLALARRHLPRSLRSAIAAPVLICVALVALGGCSDSDDDDKGANIRLLNLSSGYNSLDLYVGEESDDAGTIKFQGVGYEGLSDYGDSGTTTFTLKFKRNGITSTLQQLSDLKPGKDAHRTYLAYGSSGNFGVTEIKEDESAANSGTSKLQVINVAEAGAVDVYLTDATVALTDTTPLLSTLGHGATSGISYVDSGSYRLRVVGAGDTTDLRLDIPTVTLDSTKMQTLILTSTSGGVLVNGLMLPQRGQLAINRNTKARVRGAVGISNGTSATASIGDVTLIASAGAGVVGGRYLQVDSGTVAVNLKVDGTIVPTSNQALTAGNDYTMLFWNNASGTQLSLLGDDNHASSSGKAKLRLVNGMSAQGQPITLALDFSPVVEGIPVGQASAYTEFDAGTDYQFDVSDTSTAATLLTKTSVTLVGSGVYTMFVSGSPTVIGTLRKDR